MRTARIGEVLWRMGVINREDVDDILIRQQETRQKFGQIAIRMGLASHEQVWEAWAKQLVEQEEVDLAEIGSDTAAMNMVPLTTARQLEIVPLRLWGHHLVVAAPRDVPEKALAELASAKHCRVHVRVADRRTIKKQLRNLTKKANSLATAALA